MESVLTELAVVAWRGYDLAAASIALAAKLISQPCGPAEKKGRAMKLPCAVCSNLNVRCMDKTMKSCGLSEKALYPLMKIIAACLEKSVTKRSSLKAAEKKYKEAKYSKVSKRMTMETPALEKIAHLDISVL